MLSLRLPDDLENKLDILAQKTGRTKSFYAKKAIIEYLEDMEDIYLAEESQTSTYREFLRCKVDAARESIRDGKLISNDAIEAKYSAKRG